LQMDGEQITVDLQQCTVSAVTADGVRQSWSFDIDPFARHCLLRGLDRFDFLQQAEAIITEYEERM